jgi:hypothetical protein
VNVAVSKTENTTELFENKAIHALAGNIKCTVKQDQKILSDSGDNGDL